MIRAYGLLMFYCSSSNVAWLLVFIGPLRISGLREFGNGFHDSGVYPNICISLRVQMHVDFGHSINNLLASWAHLLALALFIRFVKATVSMSSVQGTIRIVCNHKFVTRWRSALAGACVPALRRAWASFARQVFLGRGRGVQPPPQDVDLQRWQVARCRAAQVPVSDWPGFGPSCKCAS